MVRCALQLRASFGEAQLGAAFHPSRTGGGFHHLFCLDHGLVGGFQSTGIFRLSGLGANMLASE